MKKGLILAPDELSHKWIDRLVSLGVTELQIQFLEGDLVAFEKEGTPACLQLDGYLDLIDEAKARGLSVEYMAHGITHMLPRGLFDEHPEYFRMNAEGKRTPDFNLCVSDPAALEIAAQNAVRFAKSLYGSCERYHIWMSDTQGRYCQCERCRSLSPSDQHLIVVNAFAKAIREVIPGALVCFLAYQDQLKTPLKIKPEAGVFLEYADIQRDQHVALRDLPERHAEMKSLLDFFGRENSMVIDYWYDNSFFSRWTRPPQPFKAEDKIILDDAKFYAEQGFEHLTSYAFYLGREYEALYGEPDLDSYKLV